jgi:hypothetical protein
LPKDLSKLKSQFKEEDFVKDFLKIELPSKIDTIDDKFRQHLFAQWIVSSEPKSKFQEMKAKLPDSRPSYKTKVRLDPSKHDLVVSAIGDLITKTQVNETTSVSFVVPTALRSVLFEGWEEKGFDFVRLLLPYGKKKL